MPGQLGEDAVADCAVVLVRSSGSVQYGAERAGQVGMAAEPEALETVACTRFVLDCGAAGDLLNLYAALAPCVLGYAEIGLQLAARPMPGNPYAAWIATCAGPDYQAAAGKTRSTLARLWAERGGDARAATLQATFDTAVRLETAFCGMGWRGAGQAGSG